MVESAQVKRFYTCLWIMAHDVITNERDDDVTTFPFPNAAAFLGLTQNNSTNEQYSNA